MLIVIITILAYTYFTIVYSSFRVVYRDKMNENDEEASNKLKLKLKLLEWGLPPHIVTAVKGIIFLLPVSLSVDHVLPVRVWILLDGAFPPILLLGSQSHHPPPSRHKRPSNTHLPISLEFPINSIQLDLNSWPKLLYLGTHY